MTGSPPTRGEAERARREAREAAALRENLRRRKQQGRLRAATESPASDAPEASEEQEPPVPDRP